MPTKRTRRSRARLADLSAVEKLRDAIGRGVPWQEHGGEHVFGCFDLYALVAGRHYAPMCAVWNERHDDETPKLLWSELRDDILAEHIKHKPGTRPWGWWRYDAPEMRRPIARQCFEHRDCDGSHVHDDRLPAFEDPHLPAHFKKNSFGKPNAYDGWRYESEREYLERLNLLTTQEVKK